MDLNTILSDLNLSEEQAKELSEAIRTNPMNSLALFQKYQISPEVIQSVIGKLMANPELLMQTAKQMGVSDEDIEKVKGTFNNQKPTQ